MKDHSAGSGVENCRLIYYTLIKTSLVLDHKGPLFHLFWYINSRREPAYHTINQLDYLSITCKLTQVCRDVNRSLIGVHYRLPTSDNL